MMPESDTVRLCKRGRPDGKGRLGDIQMSSTPQPGKPYKERVTVFPQGEVDSKLENRLETGPKADQQEAGREEPERECLPKNGSRHKPNEDIPYW